MVSNILNRPVYLIKTIQVNLGAIIYMTMTVDSQKSRLLTISKLSQVPTMKPSKLTVKVPKKLYKRVSSARSSGKRLKIALKRKKSVSSVFQDQRNLHQ